MHANLNLLNIVTRVQEMHSEFNWSNVRIKKKKIYCNDKIIKTITYRNKK